MGNQEGFGKSDRCFGRLNPLHAKSARNGQRPSTVTRGGGGHRSLPATAIMTAIHKTDRVGAAIALAPQAPDQDDD